MKKIIFLCIALLTVIVVSSQQAEARVTVLYGNGPEFQQLYELPDSITSEEGAHMNFGLTFEQFSLFYVPIWNYGEVEYALYDDANQTIYSLEEEDVAFLKDEYGWELDENPSLSLWNRFGGKLILLVVILLVVVGWIWKNKENKGETANGETSGSTAVEDAK